MAKTIVGGVEFVNVWESCNTVKEVAEKTGLKMGSVQARASKCRADGIPLKTMKRGGGHKSNKAELLSALATIRGVTVEALEAEALAKKAKVTA